MSGELDGTLKLHTVGYCVTFQLSSRPLNSSVRCFASCYIGNLPSLFFCLRLRLGWGYSLRLLSSTTHTQNSRRFFRLFRATSCIASKKVVQNSSSPESCGKEKRNPFEEITFLIWNKRSRGCKLLKSPENPPIQTLNDFSVWDLNSPFERVDLIKCN